jgi:homoserine kinase
MRLTARVPATSANLGPGFDCFGLALDLVNEVTVATGSEPGVTWQGEGADELPTDGTDMVSRAMAHVARAMSGEGRLPPLRLSGINRIPLQSGLGSSAAAAVAGVALGARLLGSPHDLRATFAMAADLEGHADNAAAAVYGGFTLVTSEGSVLRFDPHRDLRPVVLVPEGVRLPTEEARRALPRQVPREDAVFNVAHAALMVAAILRRPELLYTAMRDRLHQDVRLALVPEVRDLFDRLSAAGIPICVSGAGPSLLAFERDGHPVPDPGDGWRVLRLPVRAVGVEVSEG